MNVPTQMDLLELDIDTRISDLWARVPDAEREEWDLQKVASFIRAAYAQGYTDACTDPYPSEFFHANGYQMPRRREA